MLDYFLKGKEAIKKNQGSSIVTVLVTIAFVSILGATLLSVTYTGLLIKTTDRRGEENFYNATAVLDQIQAGFQEVAAEAIRESYQDVLKNYNEYSQTLAEGQTMDDLFAAEVVRQIQEDVTIKDAKTNQEHTIIGKNSTVYDYEAVTAMLNNTNAETESISWDGSLIKIQSENGETIEVRLGRELGTGTGGAFYYRDYLVESGDVNRITFNGFHVSYTDANGYNTEISADISITIPDFHLASGSGFDSASITEYALVANDTIGQTTVEPITLTGSVYANKFLLDIGGDFDFVSGTIIANEDIEMSTNKEVTFADGTNLWTGDIKVGAETDLALNGIAYVENDLDINGTGASVSVTNQYYGFGSSTNSVEQDGVADESSAILVNAQGTTLDLANASQVMLAGHSFIGSAESVMMGESISVKTNQRIYLAPLSAITSVNRIPADELTNPYVSDTDFSVSEASITRNEAAEILGEKTLNDYEASIVPVSVVLTSDQKVTYFYLQFPTAEKANEYFKDYFQEKPEEITEYLSVYTTLSQVTDAATTSGHYIEQSDTQYSLGDEQALNESDYSFTKNVSTTYEALCQTLTSQGEEGMTPYNHLVFGKNVNALIGEDIADEFGEDELSLSVGEAITPSSGTGAGKVWEFKDESGVVRALLVSGAEGAMFDFQTVTGWREYGNVNAVITAGGIGVNVAQDYEGLIISSGNIRLVTGVEVVSANSEKVLEAYEATIGSGDNVVSFRQLLEVADTRTAIEGSDSWDMRDLVSYENWTEY